MTVQWIVEVDWPKDGTWSDEGARAVKVQTKRGRDRMLSASGIEPMRAGECVITLDNWDGRFDPFNSGGALYGYLLPGRPFRLSAKEGVLTQAVFAGYLTDVRPLGRLRTQAVLKAADGLYFLDMQDCEAVTPESNYLVSAAMQDLLEMSEWPTTSSLATFPFTFPLTLSAFDVADNGDTIDDWDTDTGKSILSTLEELAEAFAGTVFTKREGSFEYATRDRDLATSATIEEADVLTDIETTTPWDNIFNDIRVTPTAGAVQTASATASETAYGRRTMKVNGNDYIQSEAHAESLANWLRSYAPELKRGFRLRLEDQFSLQYGVELMDRVDVTMGTLGVDGYFSVGMIEHEWQAGAGGWTRLTIEADAQDVSSFSTFPFTFPLTLEGW